MRLSVVIPTLNEAARIGELVAYLRTIPDVDEIIVTDGGSTDGTVEIARAAGALVAQSVRNRGTQLNTGVLQAGGEILWFLHADARPHPDSARHIKETMAQPQIVGGNFRLCFDEASIASRLFEGIAGAQRRLGIYYGDSSLFVRRDVFKLMNGYQEWPLFEDYDFARRLEKHARRCGGRTEYSGLPLIVSARRFRDRPMRTVLLWASLQTLFSLGVPPHRLARRYHSGHNRKRSNKTNTLSEEVGTNE